MNDLNTLTERLERVERENRAIKRAGWGIFLIAACVVVMGQARPSRTIAADKFVLTDTAGRQRLVIGTPKSSGVAVQTDADEPVIWLVGRNGVDRAILTTDGLRFSDEKGKALGSYLAEQRR